MNEIKINELSVLLPSYNNCCVELVAALKRQADDIVGIVGMWNFRYEIIVADDGSTDMEAVDKNAAVDEMENCRYVRRERNTGRSAIRNFLAGCSKYGYLLFIDSDLEVVCDDFLMRYLKQEADVVYGGIRIVGERSLLGNNLRYLYEKEAEPRHTIEKRLQSPYKDFHTANFMIKKVVFLEKPFTEKIKKYGYEDVLFGKSLKDRGVGILQIDNPIGFTKFEGNGEFVAKTEESLRTLMLFADDIKGYNSLLALYERLKNCRLLPLVQLWHRLFGGMERRNLTGCSPCLRLFNIYRLGYFVCLH